MIRHRLACAVAALVVSASLVSCTEWGGNEVSLEDSASTGGAAAGKRPPDDDDSPGDVAKEPDPSEGLDWDDCGAGIECATLPVPLSHEDPDGEQIEIALARRPAADQDDRIGSLLVNPGGPGASGVEMVSYLSLPSSVAERFDLVGFDPRGVGDSTALDCHTHLQAIYDADPTMEDQADVDRFRQASQAFVDECEQEHADLLPHLGTENVAHDLDLIRRALGDDELNYVGYSYGTSIGQQYARLYPEKVRAMVLDGVVDTTATGLEAAAGQAEGFTRALNAYIADCDARNCLGAPAGGIVDLVVATSEMQPIPAAGADRPATPGVVSLALARALYSELLWPQLTRALLDARGGNGTGLVRLADEYLDRQADGSYANGFEIYFAVSCLDAEWPRSFDEVLATGKQVAARFPRVGEALVNDYARCALWPVEPDPLEPVPTDIEGLPPLVVISTTGDPATPYQSGVALAERIPGARLITNVGEGHTVFGNGVRCVDDAVARYLVDLEAPDDGLRCG